MRLETTLNQRLNCEFSYVDDTKPMLMCMLDHETCERNCPLCLNTFAERMEWYEAKRKERAEWFRYK